MALQQERHFFLEDQTIILKTGESDNTIILQVRETDELLLTREEARDLACQLVKFANEVNK